MITYRGRAVTDLVVVVPGILGSRLLKHGVEVWGTTPRRLLVNLANFGRTVRSSLAIAPDVDPDEPGDGVQPNGLITGLSVFPGWLGMDFYDGLRRNLRRDLQLAEGQLCDFAYDWRLSSRVNGRELAAFLDRKVTEYRARSGYRQARSILICHSMGGLVARWCVDKAGGAPLVSKIVTIGTPHKGSVLALDAVANGVRLPRGIGVDLTELALSLPSLYELLPTYSCVELNGTGLRDVRDKDVLAKLATLCPAELKDVESRVEGGLGLHDELAAAAPKPGTNGCELICFRGADQETPVMATIGHGGLRTVNTINGVDRGGDGVVPDDSGVPAHWDGTGAAKSAGGKHSALCNGQTLREELRVTLRHAGRLMAPAVRICAAIPSDARAGQAFEVEAQTMTDPDGRRPRVKLVVTVEPEVSSMPKPVSHPAKRRADVYRATIPGLAPGLYRIRVGAASARARLVDDVTDWLVVYEER
jgi:pimeloyl-ACP methyl ester carboxylesterase